MSISTSLPRLGILGGIFDPIHYGHLACAELAWQHCRLNKVCFVPAGLPPHKKISVSVAPGQRLRMLELAVQGNPGFCTFDGELRRDGYSYTIDTLVELARLYPGHDQYFVIGSDNLTEIPSWHRWPEILERVVLCVAARPGYSFSPPDELHEARIEVFPSPEWGLSSTMIRSYLKRGLSCRYLVPPTVLDYIAQEALYTGSAAGTHAGLGRPEGGNCRGRTRG